LPTILDAANLTLRRKYPLDGHSLLGRFARKRLLYEYWRSGDRPSVPGWAATLTPTSEYVEWYDDDHKTITFREYYDLAKDPYQLVNLYQDGKPANDPPVTALHKRLRRDEACVGRACP
jgi:arylsulfatase A-like enzyme